MVSYVAIGNARDAWKWRRHDSEQGEPGTREAGLPVIVEEAQAMKKVRTCLILIGIAFMAYSCAISCGPGPGQSTKPITYPSGYTLDKHDENGPSK